MSIFYRIVPLALEVKEVSVPGRRDDHRTATSQQISIRHNGTIFGELTNVSKLGAMVKIIASRPPKVGEQVTLELLDGTSVSAAVVWTRANRIGLKFNLRFLEADDLLYFEHLGRDLFLRIVRHRKALARGD